MILPRFPTKLGSDAHTTRMPSRPTCSGSPTGLVENGHGNIVHMDKLPTPPVMDGGVGGAAAAY